MQARQVPPLPGGCLGFLCVAAMPGQGDASTDPHPVHAPWDRSFLPSGDLNLLWACWGLLGMLGLLGALGLLGTLGSQSTARLVPRPGVSPGPCGC